jgi:mono/diheme cytochrome c family protein
MRLRLLILAALFFLAFASPGRAQDDPAAAELASRAYTILKERCSRCHGNAGAAAGVKVLDRENLIAARGAPGETASFAVVPGDPAKSLLSQAIEGGKDSYMPQSGSPEAAAMTDAEKQTLIDWVKAGAPFPRLREIRFVGEKQLLAVMRDHLQKARSIDRPYLRFFTLANIHNNESMQASDLRLYQAALSLAVNSLSKERNLHLPQPVPGSDETVFVVDIRKLGWDHGHKWNAILKEYPYGLKYEFVRDEELQELFREVRHLSQSDLPYIRADWFTVTATQPPLYHTLLDIPQTLMELERELGLDIEANFNKDRLTRAGFSKSGVSKQNRLIERHEPTNTPYFWISYDFFPKKAKGDLVRFPLGPVFAGNRFNHQAFEHDGGEAIWSLPNGLQAYILVNAKGGRIDAGPIEVVFDRASLLGAPSIVNGISCIACHRAGMITDFRDEIRTAEAVGGEAREKVKALYPPPEPMQALIQQDRDLFLRALDRTIGPYLKVGDDAKRSVTEFPQPVARVAELYTRDLSAQEVALELGIEKLDMLRAKVETNRELLRFGLGAIAAEPPGTMKRDKWETREGTSLMQDVSFQLRLGTPLLP